jgi:CelD/BcsL family acetyltransferase involved in cellulose biosynthesis
MISLEVSRQASGDIDRGEAQSTPIAVIRDVEPLVALEDAWNALAAARGPTCQLAWTAAGIAAFTGEDELRVVVAGVPPHAKAIAPLRRGRRAGAALEFISADELYEPMDFLYADAEALAAVTDELARAKVPLFLNRLPESSPTIGALRSSFRGSGLVVCRPVAAAPFIQLDAGWIRPEAKLDPRRRSDLRRAWRHARQLGVVQTEILAPKPAEVGPILDEAFRIERASWKGRNSSSLSDDAGRAKFYRKFAEDACARGVLRVCFLRIDRRAVAMQVAIESAERFWLLKIGYDEEFKRCSPGTLLTHETIRYAASRGLSGYEFLGVVEPWTAVWKSASRSCVSVRVYPARWRGLVALAADVTRVAVLRLRGPFLSPEGSRAA